MNFAPALSQVRSVFVNRYVITFFALVVLGIVAGVSLVKDVSANTWEVPQPTCPLLTGGPADRIVVQFGATEDLSTESPNGGDYGVSIPAGEYAVNLASWDNHSLIAHLMTPGHTDPTFDCDYDVCLNQPEEIYYVALNTGDKTGVIHDLATNLDQTQGSVGNVVVSSAATIARPVHGSSDTSNSNSISPLCASFDPVAPPVTTPVVNIWTTDPAVEVSEVAYGAQTVVNWSSTDATSCSNGVGNWDLVTLDPGVTEGDIVGSGVTSALVSDINLQKICTGPGSPTAATDTNSVKVGPYSEIKANGSDGPISVPWSAAVTFDTTAANESTCRWWWSYESWPGINDYWGRAPGTGSSSYQITKAGRLYYQCRRDDTTVERYSTFDSVLINFDPPTANLQATWEGSITEGPITVPVGASFTMHNMSTSANECRVRWDANNWSAWLGNPAILQGSWSSGAITASGSFEYECRNNVNGPVAADNFIVNVAGAPIANLETNFGGTWNDGPITVPHGTVVTMRNSSVDADECRLRWRGLPWIGWGSQQDLLNNPSWPSSPISEPGFYDYECRNVAGVSSDSLEIRLPEPWVTLSADPDTIDYGESVIISWQAGDIDTSKSCEVDGYWTGTRNAPVGGQTLGENILNVASFPFSVFRMRCHTFDGGLTPWEEVVVTVEHGVSADIQAEYEGVVYQDSLLLSDLDTVTISYGSAGANECRLGQDIDGGPLFWIGDWASHPGMFAGSNEAQNSNTVVGYNYQCRNTFTLQETPIDRVEVTWEPALVPLVADIKLNGQDEIITVTPGSTNMIVSRYTEGADLCQITEDGVVTIPWSNDLEVMNGADSHTAESIDGILFGYQCQNTFTEEVSPIDTVEARVITATLTADPETIDEGEEVTLTWTSNNTSSCTATEGSASWSGARTISGEEDSGPLSEDTTFVLTCSGTHGGTIVRSVEVGVFPDTPDPSVNLVATPSSVDYEGFSTLTWTSQNATSCSSNTIPGNIGTQNTTGVQVGPLTDNETYDITCSGPGGPDDSDFEIVIVDGLPDSPTVDLVINTNKIDVDTGTANLTWSSENATQCSSPNIPGTIDIENQIGVTVGPFAQEGQISYSITCSGPGTPPDIDTELLMISGGGGDEPPTVNLMVNKLEVDADIETAILTWTSTDATTCSSTTIPGAIGIQNLTGVVVGPFSDNRTFEISCTGPGAPPNATDDETIVVHVIGEAPEVVLIASPNEIDTGEDITLTWLTENADSCVASGDWSGTKDTANGGGQKSEILEGVVSPDKAFTLTCMNSFGSTEATDVVLVNQVFSDEWVDIKAFDYRTGIEEYIDGPVLLDPGKVNWLSWDSNETTDCSIDFAGVITGGNRQNGDVAGEISTLTDTGNMVRYSITCDTISGIPVSDFVDVTFDAGKTLAVSISQLGAADGAVTSDPVGINCRYGGTSCTKVYPSGASVRLKATPDEGSLILGWSGDTNGNCTGETEFCVVDMDQDRSVAMTFDVPGSPNKLLNVHVSAVRPGALGNITSEPTGINCGNGPVDCNEAYTTGRTVQLTATAGTGSVFVSWGGACSGDSVTCVVAMHNSLNVIANFNTTGNSGAGKKIKVIVVDDSGVGGRVTGTIAGDGSPAIICDVAGGSTCERTLFVNKFMTLNADPSSGVFWNWSDPTGACVGDNPNCDFVTNVSRTITAYFGSSDDNNSNNPSKLTVAVTPTSPQVGGRVTSNIGPINCGSVCEANYFGETVILTASPNNNFKFSTWSDPDGVCTTGSATCSVVMTEARSITAHFVADDGTIDTVDCPAEGPGRCPQCNDGVDNDLDGEGGTIGDGLIDYPSDALGCFNLRDNNESDPVVIGNCPEDGIGVCPACNDGVDNDGDGKYDWAGFGSFSRDASCQGQPNKDKESGIDVIEI